MYHAVETKIPEDKYGLYTIQRKQFVEQMACLVCLSSMPIVSFDKAISGLHGVAITFDDGYRDVLTEAMPVLMRMGIPITVFVTVDYICSGNKIYLSQYDLRELAACPDVNIGSHGMSHARLTQCENAKLKNELVGSRNFLEDVIQRPVNVISYPYGAVDNRVKQATLEAGYQLAACSKFGTNYKDSDPLLLKRTDIWSNDTLGDFRSKVSGDWDWLGLRT